MAAIRGTFQPRFKASLPNLNEAQHPSSGGATVPQRPPLVAGRSGVPSQGVQGGGLGAFAGLAHTVQRGVGDASAIASGVWRAAHGPQGQQPHFAPNGTLVQGKEPGLLDQLNALTGYRQIAPLVEHPLRALQREQAKPPMAKANDFLLAHLLIGGSPPGAAAAERSGLAVSRATFKGDLSGERFLHGAPVPFPINDFRYSARNPGALLGSGMYLNTLPERAGQYAQMSPSSQRNLAPWFQARFKDEQTARDFAKKQVMLGREVDGHVADPNFIDRNNPGSFVGPLHDQRFRSVAKRISTVGGHVSETDLNPIGGLRFSDRRVASSTSAQPGHKAQIRLGMAQSPLGGAPRGEHFVVNYRKGLAPSLQMRAIKPGTRLFDMNAPLDPGEAAQAKQLLLQQLRQARAARVSSLARREANSPTKTELHSDWFQPHPDSLHEFDTMNRLARLRAAGRAGIGRTGTFQGDSSYRYMRDAGPMAPVGRDLHELLKDALASHGLVPQGDAVARSTQHIVSNPNAILRRMGYHGLIEPEFSHSGGVGKEVVLFDKNRAEPWTRALERQNGPFAQRPVGVGLARGLRNAGADFMGALKQVKAGTPHVRLPLSDELNLDILNVGGKPRFFLHPAQYPDAVGKEINGVQALNIAHRSIVQRKGGVLSNNDVNRIFSGSSKNALDPNGLGGKPATDRLAELFRQQYPDLQKKMTRLVQSNDPEFMRRRQQVEQARARNTALGLGRPARQLSLQEVEQRLKERGRVAEDRWNIAPNGERQFSIKHTMNGVPVPDHEYLNFGNSTAEKTHGMPLTSFPQPPKAHEFFSHGTLATLIDGLTPKQADEHIQNLERNLAEAWYKDRLIENSAPHIAFPRMPLRKGYPSFGGLAPDKGMTGRAPYTMGPGMEPLQRAMKLASQHNLRGKDAALFIREYLKRRRGN